jgi:hypothetical protein
LIVTLYDRVTDVTTTRNQDVEWELFAQHLVTHLRRPSKDGPGYSPASFRSGSTREDGNAIDVHALVYDVDKISEAELVAAIERLQDLGLQWVCHTTHSHNPPDKISFRFAIALSKPVPADDWRTFYHAAAAHLGIPYERKCANPGRFWYFPSCTDDATPEAHSFDGDPLDPETITLFPSNNEALNPHTPHPGDRPPASMALIAEVAQRLAELGPAKQGEGGDAKTYQACAMALHSYALSEDEALGVLSLWDATNRPPWKTAGLRTKLRNASRYAKGTYGERRDAFEIRSMFQGGQNPSPLQAFDTTPDPDIPAVPSEYYAHELGMFLGQDDPGDASDNWIVHGVIAAGMPQIVGGPPKSHKTFILEHLLISVAAGLPTWLGKEQFKITPSKVLMLLREDSFKESRRRVWRLARGLGLDPRDLEGKLWIDCETPFYFQQNADLEKLAKTIQDRGINVVAIDSLSRTHTGDENSVKEMSIVTTRWNDLCQKLKIAVPIIHHFNKWGEGPLLQRLRGSSDIGAMVRHIVGVTKLETGSALMQFEGNLHPIMEDFHISITDGLVNGNKTINVNYVGESKSIIQGRIDQDILESLAASSPGGLNATELKAQITGNNDQIVARRNFLQRAGKIMEFEKRFHLVAKPPGEIK